MLADVIDLEMKENTKGFPLDVFPDAIQELIKDAENTKLFNPDYFSAGILSACSTAIGNSVSLYNGSYSAKPILWISIIGSRGVGKSHPLEFAKAPLEQKDSDAYTFYKTELTEYEKQEVKGKKPRYSKLILNDFTPEKLADVLQHSEKGILIFQDELMRWINSFDQYKKGGDQQMYLSLFNGSTLTVERVSKEPIRIEQTNVNIIGGMQPEIIKQLAQNNRSEDGFLDRFLFVYPKNLKPSLYTGKDISGRNRENYWRFINNLLDVPEMTIKAKADNVETYKKWQHQKITECFDDTIERAIQAKMETYVWRLALVLEMMQQATLGDFTPSLSNASLSNAIRLAEYFRENALTINDKITVNNPLEDITGDQLELYTELPYDFKRSQVLALFEAKAIKGRSIDRFLSKKKLFQNYRHGHYKKKH